MNSSKENPIKSAQMNQVLRDIDRFTEGKNIQKDEILSQEFVKTTPLASKRLIAKILNKLFYLPLFIIKRSTKNYFVYRREVDADILSRLTNIEHENNSLIDDMHQSLDQKVYEMMKLTDALKSELMAEINKGSSPLGDQEEITPEIINESKVRKCKKMNLGSGSHIFNNYINVDHRAIEGVDLVADIRKLPIKAGTIEEILVAHVVEHFTGLHMRDILTYWYMLLKENGIIRIIVPDIASMAGAYVKGEVTWESFRQVILGGQDYASDYHFNAFSKDYLKNFVASVLPDASIEIVAEGRKNGEALELEAIVTKPRRAK